MLSERSLAVFTPTRLALPMPGRARGGVSCAALLIGLWLSGCSSAQDSVTLTPNAGDGTAGAGNASTGSAGPGSAGPGSAGVAPAEAGSGGDGASGDGSGAPSCDVIIDEHPPASANHLPLPCEPTTYDTNPPSGGDHYASWAAFQTYDFPVPQGFLVHSLEHGAVIYWYNCPDGCADDVARASSFVAALPADPACAGMGTQRRVILVPSPSLPTRWAASSWGFTLTSDCFEESAMRAFYDAHYAKGPEDFCSAGLAITPNTCPE